MTLLWRENRQIKQAQDYYYPLLSRTLLLWEMRLRWRDLRLRTILCLLALVLLIYDPLSFSVVPITLWQWLQDYLVLAFMVLCLDIAIDVRRLTPWRKLAKATR